MISGSSSRFVLQYISDRAKDVGNGHDSLRLSAQSLTSNICAPRDYERYKKILVGRSGLEPETR